jgi:hypothetical protein
MEFASMARHGPRRRTIHEFASVVPILPADIQRCTAELVDGPPARTMTMEIKRDSIGPYEIALHWGPKPAWRYLSRTMVRFSKALTFSSPQVGANARGVDLSTARSFRKQT